MDTNEELPFWNEEVGLYKEEALEAQWVWEVSEEPNSGPIFDEKRSETKFLISTRLTVLRILSWLTILRILTG